MPPAKISDFILWYDQVPIHRYIPAALFSYYAIPGLRLDYFLFFEYFAAQVIGEGYLHCQGLVETFDLVAYVKSQSVIDGYQRGKPEFF